MEQHNPIKMEYFNLSTFIYMEKIQYKEKSFVFFTCITIIDPPVINGLYMYILPILNLSASVETFDPNYWLSKQESLVKKLFLSI